MPNYSTTNPSKIKQYLLFDFYLYTHYKPFQHKSLTFSHFTINYIQYPTHITILSINNHFKSLNPNTYPYLFSLKSISQIHPFL